MNHPTDKRAAAIADFRESGDTIAEVADRHGIARSTLGTWTAGIRDEQLAYRGASDFDPTAWELRGGVRYPLFPVRRSA